MNKIYSLFSIIVGFVQVYLVWLIQKFRSLTVGKVEKQHESKLKQDASIEYIRVIMPICARPGCHRPAKSSCSRCLREQYCSSYCQKTDWKAHKSMCPTLKKLSKKLEPYREVARIFYEIIASTKVDDIRVLEHLLAYAEYQFGEQVTGKGYRERADGERIENWEAEISIIHHINKRLCCLHNQNNAISVIDRDNVRSHYQSRSLSLLNPWLVILDADANNGIDSLNEKQKNTLLKGLHDAENSLAVVNMNRRQFDTAEGHCERSLAYSKRYRLEGEGKTTMIFESLKTFCSLRELQMDYSGALAVAEEAYNLVVETYDPVHLQVQEAAGLLIDILIRKGDLFDAERYAQVTYGNLRDKKNGIDQEGEVMATGAYNLANVILQQIGDTIESEELARECLRIRSVIFGSDHHIVGTTCDLLAKILCSQLKFGNETRGLYERCLAISLKHTGPDGYNFGVANNSIALFYQSLAGLQLTTDLKRTKLLLAKFHLEECLRIYSKIYGPTHSITLNSESALASISNELSIMSLD